MSNVLSFLEEKEKLVKDKKTKQVTDLTHTTDARSVFVCMSVKLIMDYLSNFNQSNRVVVPMFTTTHMSRSRDSQTLFVTPPDTGTYGLWLSSDIVFENANLRKQFLDRASSLFYDEEIDQVFAIYQWNKQVSGKNDVRRVSLLGTNGNAVTIDIRLSQVKESDSWKCEFYICMDVPVTKNPLDNIDHLFAMDLMSYAYHTFVVS